MPQISHGIDSRTRRMDTMKDCTVGAISSRVMKQKTTHLVLLASHYVTAVQDLQYRVLLCRFTRGRKAVVLPHSLQGGHMDFH